MLIYTEKVVENLTPLNTRKYHYSIRKQFTLVCKERSFHVNKQHLVEDIARILMDCRFNMKKFNGKD